jgi:ABC-2 type transport system ATP-binding protein
MLALDVKHIVKSYAEKIVVNDVSFSVYKGEIFGLIGPNGAGKTSTIRMIMDITKPDSGDISILGEKLNEKSKNRIGYLPEERGLYRKLSVIDCITYFASLKGMARQEIKKKADQLLDQTGMLPHKRKKIEELSKGMGQTVQFIITILHDPELIVMDEPFTGFDPVHVALIKDLFLDLKNKGKAIILSTHQMNQVEELCDRTMMINKGNTVLHGTVQEIRRKYKGNSVLIDAEGEIGQIPGVIEKRTNKNYIELVLDKNTAPKQVLERLLSTGITINRFEVAVPSLNEIFISVVNKGNE